MANDGKKIKVTLVKGTNACRAEHRATVRALGLRRIRDSKVVADTREVRGMINAARHLLAVEKA